MQHLGSSQDSLQCKSQGTRASRNRKIISTMESIRVDEKNIKETNETTRMGEAHLIAQLLQGADKRG